MANKEKFVFQKIGSYEPKTEEFVLEIDDLPSRSQIRVLEKQCQSSHCRDGLIKVSDITFKSGLLSAIKNLWEITITSAAIRCSLSVTPEEMGVSWCLKSCEVKFYSNNQMHSSLEFDIPTARFYSSDCTWSGELKIPNNECWNDDVDQIRFNFLVQRSEIGKIIPFPDPETIAKKLKTPVDSDSKDYSCTSHVWNISSEFFLSKDYSDFIFICEGQEFPSHRLLLSIRSPVFYRMLRPDSMMKEAKEGKVVITDMTTRVLKEFLRFMYSGKVENLKEIADSLILPADKYDLPSLKAMCEKSLVQQVNLENALAYFSLADSVQAKNLKFKSFNCIRTNKWKMFQNSKDFVQFTQKYPDIMFQLFKTYSS